MQKRKDQMFAAQNVWEMEDYSKKYSMIEKLLGAMFPVSEFLFEFPTIQHLQVLNSSREVIIESNFDPKGILPKDKHLMDGE